MKKIKILIAFLAATLASAAHADKLQEILKSGTLRIGTTGDYKPFSLYDGKTYSGYDIDVANYLTKQLNVKLKLVRTTWKDLLSDLENDKFDVAMGGITRRTDRQLRAEQTQGYMTFGKCFLVAKGKVNQFNSIEEVNQVKVRVGINIGGTNEIFAKANLPHANITRYENNLEIPKAVATGKIDVMVTETPEALFYQATDHRLEASRCNEPFTKDQFGYLVAKGEQRLLNTINFIMDDMKLKNIDQKLMQQNFLER